MFIDNPKITPIWYSLVNDVNAAVSKLQSAVREKLNQIQSQNQYHGEVPPPQFHLSAHPERYQPRMGEKLPWLNHGLRGFLHKLWYGNSAANPNWQGFRRNEHLTLEEYMSIEADLDTKIGSFFEEFEEYTEIQSLLNDFRKQLIRTIKNHMNSALGVMKSMSPEELAQAIKSNPSATTISQPTPSPAARPTPEEIDKEGISKPKPKAAAKPPDSPSQPKEKEEKPEQKKPETPREASKYEPLLRSLAMEIQKNPEIYDNGYEILNIKIDGKDVPDFAFPSNMELTKDKEGALRAIRSGGPDIPAAIEFFNNLPEDTKKEISRQIRLQQFREESAIARMANRYLKLLGE